MRRNWSSLSAPAPRRTHSGTCRRDGRRSARDAMGYGDDNAAHRVRDRLDVHPGNSDPIGRASRQPLGMSGRLGCRTTARGRNGPATAENSTPPPSLPADAVLAQLARVELVFASLNSKAADVRTALFARGQFVPRSYSYACALEAVTASPYSVSNPRRMMSAIRRAPQPEKSGTDSQSDLPLVRQGGCSWCHPLPTRPGFEPRPDLGT